jgi:hypothetical protein
MSAAEGPLAWYPRNRAWLAGFAGPDLAHQRLLAHELALWSRTVNPDTSFKFALAAHNAWEAGAPLDVVRTRRDAGVYREAREMGLMPVLSPKSRAFAEQMCCIAESPDPWPVWIVEAVGPPLVPEG